MGRADFCLELESLSAHAVPIPSQAHSPGEKRFCKSYNCRLAEPVRTFPYSCFLSHTQSRQSPATGSASQPGTETLADVLINALQTYQAQSMPSNSDTTVDLATPQSDGPGPVVDTTGLGDAAF